MMTSTTAQTTFTAAECLAEIASRRIGLTCAFDGRVWLAFVELKGEGANRRRNLRAVSATGSTPLASIRELIVKLDGTPQAQSLFEEDECPW